MDSILGRQNLILIGALAVTAALVQYVSRTEAAPKKLEDSEKVVQDRRDLIDRATPAPGSCGEMYLDRTTGGMLRRPNVDLVVRRLEIATTERGAWIIPTIRNRCVQRIRDNIHVSIGAVVVTFAGLLPKTDVSLGYAVGVPIAASYTATVNYDGRIAEADDRNNSCTRSTTGNCP